MEDHDTAYRLIFSHAETIRDLLVPPFVPDGWVTELDMNTLERVGGSYVSDDLRARSSDVIWRVRWGKEWVYVYLLLEFQSTEDRYMAVRMLTYLGLLYQDLIRGGQLDTQGRLPAVLPIVLYNGLKPWRAATDVRSLVGPVPTSLREFQPALKYLLLDELRVAERPLPERNLVAAIFQLEKSNDFDGVRTVVAKLLTWLNAPEQAGLRRNIATWLRRVVLPRRIPGANLPGLHDLQEVTDMALAERMQQLYEENYAKGQAKGEADGKVIEARRILVRQLNRRFGALPTEVMQRLNDADVAALENWADRILDAQSLDEVFT